MGHVRHHAIIVTSNDYEIKKAYSKALEIFGENLSEITPITVNGYQSFLVPPDGSKEGWPESECGDDRRREFKDWLDSQAYEDHSTPFSWIEVYYGGDDNEPMITDDCYEALRSKIEDYE